MEIYNNIIILLVTLTITEMFFMKYDIIHLSDALTYYKKNDQKTILLFLFISMIVLCVISSMRGQNVGTDLPRYIYR